MKTACWSITLLFIQASLLLTGCVQTTWVRLEEPVVKAPDGSFSADVPRGWVQNIGDDKGVVLVTRDGILLQYIRLERTEHEEAFPEIDQRVAMDMLPSDVAELLLAELRSEELMANLEVLENAPATIADHNGVVVQVSFKTDDGLEYKRRVYAFVAKTGFYSLTYQAPSLYYFPLHLDAYERAVSSFQL